MRKIKPFSMISMGYNIRITRIRVSSHSNALGKYIYSFKLIVKDPKREINFITEVQKLDADDLQDFKIKLRSLFLQIL